MKRTGGGCILFTSSGLGMRAFPQALAYSLSKAALIQLTRSLAVQLGSDNIRVNALCPGPVDTTDLFQNMPLTGTAEDIAARINTERPVPRFGTTEEMARAALFLISPESAYITGVALPVDGGGVAC